MKSFLKYFAKIKDSVTVIMIILLITKILGFLKTRIYAQLFGASAELDIFFAAFTIPDTIFNVLVAGSINAAIIPVFSDILHKKGEKDLKGLFNKISFIYIAFLVVCSLLMIVFSKNLALSMVNSHTLNSFLGVQSKVTVEQVDVLSDLIKIMMLSPIFLAFSNFLTAYLQTNKKFFSTSLAPLFYNIATIFGSLFLVNKFRIGVYALAWAVVLASAMHLLVQIPEFLKYYASKEFRIRSSIKGFFKGLFYKDTVHLFFLAFPRILGLLGEYVTVMFNTMLAFTLNTGMENGGALSAYRFATNLYFFPIHIVVSSISQVALPSMSEEFAQNRIEKFKETFNKAMQQMIYILLPVTAIILVLRMPVVRITLGVGNFTWWDTVITSWCLAMLSISIVPQAVSTIVFRAFYAIHETWLPLLATAIGIVANVVLGYMLTNFFSHYFDWRPILAQIFSQLSVAGGSETVKVAWSFIQDSFKWSLYRGSSDASIGGLALAYSLTFYVETAALMLLLNKKIKAITWKETMRPFFIKMINTLFMAGSMYFVFKISDMVFDTSRTFNVFIVSIVTILYGALMYIIGSKVLNIPEFDMLYNKFATLSALFLRKFKLNLKSGIEKE